MRVTDNGVRTWIVEHRVDGKTVRRKLGRVSGSGRDAISAEHARKLAMQRSGELVQGVDVYADLRGAWQKVADFIGKKAAQRAPRRGTKSRADHPRTGGGVSRS